MKLHMTPVDNWHDTMTKVFIDALTLDSLLQQLAKTDISVPLRTEGRTTQHTELATISHLVSTLGSAGRLTYPLTVGHGDRPDFVLSEEGRRIGIEVVEAIPEAYAAYCALAEREFPDAPRDLGLFRPGSPQRSLQELRDLLHQGKLSGEPWCGDAPERAWSAFIADAVARKVAKLRHLDFQRHERNWLSIYDNLPYPIVDLAKALPILRSTLADLWADQPTFDRIYIEHGPVLVQLSPDDVEHLVITDLW